MRRKLYLDLDDTYLTTELYLRKVVTSNGLKLYPDDTVYVLRDLVSYKEIFDMLYQDYSVIPKKVGAVECLKLLKTEYDIVFCSSCYSKEEEEAKRRFAREEGIPIIICKSREVNKSHIDMSGAVMVDDNVRILGKSSASEKYCMFNKYSYNTKEDVLQFDGEYVFDWFQLTDKLLKCEEGEEDAVLRRYFRERIPEFCKTNSRV